MPRKSSIEASGPAISVMKEGLILSWTAWGTWAVSFLGGSHAKATKDGEQKFVTVD